MKQMISLFIAASLLASLAACGSGAAETQDSSDNTVGASSTETPEVKYDFGGREYRILCRTDKSYEFDIKEPNGDIVDDAVYKRNLKIENECNISIKPITADGNWDSREIFMNLIASSVLAGEDAYDLVAGYNAYIATLITHGYLIDMNIMGIDFSSPWWYAGFNDNVSIGDKMFFCLGDASLTMWENLEVVLFNRSLIRDFNLTSPYELVNNDEWYFDTMRRMCADISSDLNQDGAYKENDRWGMIFYNKRDLAVYLGNSYCTFDADGYPVLSLYNERLVDQYAEIYDFLNTSNEARQFVPDTDQLIFSEGRALFFQAPLRYAELLRDSEVDFGMLPFPKLDESQEDYIS
ncbi:MAG: hypothetical protein ACI3XM_05960, partial [Eubacteriales bacterium]